MRLLVNLGRTLAIGISGLALAQCATHAPAPTTHQHSAHDHAAMVQAQRIAAVRGVLQEAVDKNIAAGYSAALTDARGNTVTTFVGMADKEAGKPIDQDTVFRLFSMTKPITAVAIMMLVEDGKIGLDAPVATYIPSFANAKVYVSGDTLATLVTAPLERPLTVRDVLRQTSGMPYFGAAKPVERLYAMNGIERAPGETVPGFTGPRVASLAELADRIAATPLSDQPGARYQYGNAIDLLGRIVEVASGQSLGTFFQERIFTPLKMDRTAFSTRPGDDARLAVGYFATAPSAEAPSGAFFGTTKPADTPVHLPLKAVDQRLSVAWTQAPARLEFGGSGLVGPLMDYVRFARMIAQKGTLDGVRILKPETIAEMGANQLSPAAGERLLHYGYGYGLGFGTVGDSQVSRSGAPAGTMFWSGAAGTYFWANPGTGESGVVMTQIFGGYSNVYQGAAVRAAHGQPVN